MEDPGSYFKELYKNFNERNIDLVLANTAPTVKWANGMEGGYVYGQEAVKEYWTRQFNLVSSTVTPMEIKEVAGEVVIKVQQVVHDLDGNLLSDQMVEHVFLMDKNKITEFNIR
ncbi:MAG: hypothetical protein ABIQ31_11265 [Ferruginibacter sp.]